MISFNQTLLLGGSHTRINAIYFIGVQVSRRLARRIHKELRSEKFGYVKLAVHAYEYLLGHLNDEDCNLFAKELVVGPVVGLIQLKTFSK